MQNKNNISLMLDSGAFSAWMAQKEIPIADYGKFVCEYMNDFDLVVNLDVIPGKFGQKNITPQELQDSVNKGFDNYKTLLSMGIPREKLIHVFHQGEDFTYLSQMTDEMDYIGISPGNDRTTAEKKVWLDQCMKYVLDKNGNPKVKFHGFGITSLHLIYRYKWYSVDSTTWVVNGKFGRILYPKTKFGAFTYKESPIIIPISKESPDKYQDDHYKSLSSIEQAKVKAYLKERNFSIKSVSSRCISRDRANMRFFLDMEQTLDKTKIYFAGNFVLLSKLSREIKTMKMSWGVTNQYKRLGSYYHKKYLLKLVELKDYVKSLKL